MCGLAILVTSHPHVYKPSNAGANWTASATAAASETATALIRTEATNM